MPQARTMGGNRMRLICGSVMRVVALLAVISVAGCAGRSAARIVCGAASEDVNAEVPGDVDSTVIHRIGFGSCCHQDKPQDIWTTIVATDPDLFVMLGDNIYADTEDMSKMRTDYAKLGAVPAFQELRASCPILATWDDHDYGKNDAGAEYPMKRESQKALLEFFEEPGESPRWGREGVYGAKVFGPPGRRVQVILLDTRYFRSPLKTRENVDSAKRDGLGKYVPNTDPGATILGDAQWKWLDGQLRQPAEVRLLASGIQVVADDHGFEKWGNIPHERDRLFKLIRETAASGVIVLSGDRHAAEVSRIDEVVGYPLYDITASALNRPRSWMLENNRFRIGTQQTGALYFDSNFGFMSIDWERADPLITMQIRNEQGKPVIVHEVSLGSLRSR